MEMKSGTNVGVSGIAGGNIGLYYSPISKFNIYVLTADKDSFDSFLVLDDSVDRKKNNYIFVERAADIKNSADIKILDDFCLNPEIVEILYVLNKGLYFNKWSGTIPTSGTYTDIKISNAGTNTITIDRDSNVPF